MARWSAVIQDIPCQHPEGGPEGARRAAPSNPSLSARYFGGANLQYRLNAVVVLYGLNGIAGLVEENRLVLDRAARARGHNFDVIVVAVGLPQSVLIAAINASGSYRWKDHMECRAGTVIIRRGESSPMSLDDRAADGEPKA
jgi:hypothetical protein